MLSSLLICSMEKCSGAVGLTGIVLEVWTLLWLFAGRETWTILSSCFLMAWFHWSNQNICTLAAMLCGSDVCSGVEYTQDSVVVWCFLRVKIIHEYYKKDSNQRSWNVCGMYNILQGKEITMNARCFVGSVLSKHQNLRLFCQSFVLCLPFIFIQLNIYLIGVALTTLILLFCWTNTSALTFCYLCKQSGPPKGNIPIQKGLNSGAFNDNVAITEFFFQFSWNYSTCFYHCVFNLKSFKVFYANYVSSYCGWPLVLLILMVYLIV